MDNWSLISIYTTKQAVADGVLIRVNDALSKQMGIRYPVYLSLGVFSSMFRFQLDMIMNWIVQAVCAMF